MKKRLTPHQWYITRKITPSAPTPLILFNISTLEESGCIEYPPNVHVAVDNVAYHDGVNAEPILGDNIYSDALGTTPYPDNSSSTDGSAYWSGTKHIKVISGVMSPIFCK